MTTNPSSESTVRPLSVGNIVSAAVRLYRDRPGTYLPLSIFAYLWVLVPVYGWAKYCAISGLMSRVAFGELTRQPESLDTARARVRPRLWSFLWLAILIFIRILGLYIGGVIAIAVVAGILSAIFPPLGILVGIVLGIGFLVLLIRFFSRWFIAEVPLAIESGATGGKSIDRSWQLTQKSIGRIYLVVLATILITLPINLITGYLPNIMFTFVLTDNPALGQLVTFVLGLVGGIVVLPFWQIVKAVTYYDLRSRQEGLDLELRSEET